MDWSVYLLALGVILSLAVAAWAVSVFARDVSFVDSLWSPFFLLAAVVYAASLGTVEDIGSRGLLVLILVAVWSLRLSIYITARNWGEGEDYRYRKIRADNDPGFWFKSLYIVFLLQGLLAWIISVALLPAVTGGGALNALDYLALALWLVGFLFESVGDYQLSRFKAQPGNEGKVMDRGLWRYTRHPNYFGDFCVWWSFYLFALAAGAWWSVVAPLLMSFLLLKVSGVSMLEKTITDRRPKYADYIARTNAFFPGPPKSLPAPQGAES
ncbi:MAG: DUF1295 domain-containing protein [Pseudomonadota bacterium]